MINKVNLPVRTICFLSVSFTKLVLKTSCLLYLFPKQLTENLIWFLVVADFNHIVVALEFHKFVLKLNWADSHRVLIAFHNLIFWDGDDHFWKPTCWGSFQQSIKSPVQQSQFNLYYMLLLSRYLQQWQRNFFASWFCPLAEEN